MNNFEFYVIGFIFVLLGIAFFLIPLLNSSGALKDIKIPTILLYVYKSNGFYFATSPILLIISLIMILIFLVRH